MMNAVKDTTGTCGHIPVLLNEVLAALPPARPESLLVDMTFGGGGYTKRILEKTPYGVLALDRDPDAITRGQDLRHAYPERLQLVQTSFAQLDGVLVEAGILPNLNELVEVLDAVVLDLGVSSFQLDTPERGFSFREDGPLDMRMSRAGRSAADVVADYSQDELADIFWRYGEEKLAKKMAEAIVMARVQGPITQTKQLVEVLHTVRARRHNDRVDPATKVFQALRLEVNQELEELEVALDKACKLLRPGGVVVVVTFHSLEDRIVKHKFRTLAGPVVHANKYSQKEDSKQGFALLTRKPVVPTPEEVRANPRARSAKLRVLKKIRKGDAS